MKVMRASLSAGKNNTLEHLEVMDPADLSLVAQDNLVLSVQPSHLLVGCETLDEEVGPQRASQMFPFQSFFGPRCCSSIWNRQPSSDRCVSIGFDLLCSG